MGEIDLLMDGKNLISKAKISDRKTGTDFANLKDGKLAPVKSSKTLKLEFPQETSVQLMTVHGHGSMTVKFFDGQGKLIKQDKVKVARKDKSLHSSSFALPAVHKIEVKNNQNLS